MRVEGEHPDEPSVLKQIINRPSAGDLIKVANTALVANWINKGIKGDFSWDSNLTTLTIIDSSVLTLKKIIPQATLNRESYALGEHGRISFQYYTGPRKILSDGTFIKPGSKVGEINLTKNIPKHKNLNTHEFSIELLKDFLDGLVQLAQDFKNGKFPDDICAIVGVSHLVGHRIGQKLGFDIAEPLLHEKVLATLVGLNISKDDRALRSKWKNTQKAFISVKKICENQNMYLELLDMYKKRFS
ncbi:MAG: hypothetical protein UT13_C0001G0381 [Candidatus Pacebacteria bacterium GW2011_GWF2_38_9]|nr:MAG: hypothetical protein US01_C0001G0391 [candidate division TM6 bacterium GW2011_GWF2_28_16]KKQ08458.1 MAG: hypothetical protein US20_C0016G0003 [Candidatus Pacebacteria bacterium GW2011_GWF1_36_5]KKQ88734.1 MAG: hypothetical protein UT13_C0001G0381 [Candidatus Pacebacteria bacterium GW2011_GWF2_38_9]HAZ73734.1 hypothetical protein [Candidatus Paceibacterota bacterium]